MIPRELLPEDLYDSAFIAGGWAACPALASDMDIWVEVPHKDVIDHVRALILEHLHAHYPGYAVTPQEETENAPAYFGADVREHWIEIKRVATVQGLTEEYHIMVTDGSVDAVLAHFDVSTHQIALTRGGIVRGDCWTPITVPPVKIRGTEHTEARMEKIRTRYGHIQ